MTNSQCSFTNEFDFNIFPVARWIEANFTACGHNGGWEYKMIAYLIRPGTGTLAQVRWHRQHDSPVAFIV
jgi:hypothetical protein